MLPSPFVSLATSGRVHSWNGTKLLKPEIVRIYVIYVIVLDFIVVMSVFVNAIIKMMKVSYRAKIVYLFYCLILFILFRFFCTDVKCVEDMQNNCEKSRTPYEVLIQGPVGSRFVRSLLSDDSKAQKATNPNQRSSITIFKPEDNKESVPAAEIESADKAKTDEAAKDDAKAKDVEEVPAKIEEPTKPENQAEAAKEEVKSNTEEKAKRDVEKAEAKANAGETIKTDDAAKTAAENTDDKKEDAPEEPKKDETAEQPKAEESADKPSETEKDAEKKLKKRGADDELESVVDVFAKETDGAKSEADSSKTNEGTTEPTVGIALPGVLGLKPLVPGLVGLKAAPALVALRAHLDLKKGNFLAFPSFIGLFFQATGILLLNFC